MKSTWQQFAILRAASLLAPGGERAAFLAAWRSELWYIPEGKATLFCLGAFADAFWLRRTTSSERRTGSRLESPLSCLAFLSLLTAACALIAVRLPAGRPFTSAEHIGFRSLLDGSLAMLAISAVYLPAVRLAIGPSAANPRPVPWRGKLRLGIFLALKVALVQPVVFCAFLACHGIPFGPLGMAAVWTLLCRWVLMDQRNRCPVCLRSLSCAVRIGTPSQTLLEWYGAESVCSRGHGLLQSPGISASYAGAPQWLRLGRSWGGLFAGAGGIRR